VLKLKTKEFNIHTRGHTPPVPPTTCEELTAIVLSLLSRVDFEPGKLFRLVGVGLCTFKQTESADLPTASAGDTVNRAVSATSSLWP
jgi:DNA polymerase-4